MTRTANRIIQVDVLIIVLVIALAAVTLLAACASNQKPKLPYPAFIQAEGLPDMFVASLPGVRAKPLAGDMRTQSSSNLISLPADWQGTTGAMPGKAVEIFVVAGELSLSDFKLTAGGYAYVPPGSLGFALTTDSGATLLYFLDDVDEASVIRSPIILDSSLVEWVESSTSPGRFVRELRSDPGSGARSWLLRIDPGSTATWTSTSVVREGFMLSGAYRDSECFNGEALTWDYLPGGYFLRPPDSFNGGPAAVASSTATWFMRERSAGLELTSDICFYTAPREAEAN